MPACSSVNKTSFPIDPWNGQYIHFSKKFEMSLNHFSEESVAVDIYHVSRPDKLTSNFFADIKDDEATFIDRTNPDCRVILKNTNDGITVVDQCGGGNRDTGLYTRIHKGNP